MKVKGVMDCENSDDDDDELMLQVNQKETD